MPAHKLEGLIRWVDRDEWRTGLEELLEQHIAEACEAFELSLEDVHDLLDKPAADVLWGCVFEDFATRVDDDDRNLVDDYLKRRGLRETATTRACMRALRGSVMSLYEISDVRPGESFLARDLIRGGEPVRVNEKSGSRQLRNWDLIGARLIDLGHRTEMGGGALTFTRDEGEALIERVAEEKETLVATLLELAKKGGIEADAAAIEALGEMEVLPVLAPLFTSVWLERRLRAVLEPTLPKLQNTDGEDIVFTEITYPLPPGVTLKVVRARLDGVDGLQRETASFWNWATPADPAGVRPRRGSSEGMTISSWAPDGSTILGTIELKGRALKLTVNSEGRARRGRALIEPALAGLVGEPEVSAESVEQAMERRASRPAAAPPAAPPPEEQAAVLREFMDGYYRNLLDEPVPMLGDRTPRQMAGADPQQLVAWLKLVENGAAHSMPGAAEAHDLSWMWAELGVGHLRG